MTREEIFHGESQTLEFKLEIPEKAERYIKTAVAFANGDGGTIIFGVDDKMRECVGFPEKEVYQLADKITNSIYDACEPKILPDVGVQKIDGKYLVVATVLPGMDRPYHIKSQGPLAGTYIRVSGTTREAPRYKVQEMILESSNRSFDQLHTKKEISAEEINDLCRSLTTYALEKTPEEERSRIKPITENQLFSWNLLSESAGKVFASNGALLLMGDEAAFPYATVQCAVCKGNTRGIYITRREVRGPIYEQVDVATAFVLENIRMGMRIEGIRSRDIYELPVDAIRELIGNAVCHRSYVSDEKIQIFIFDDRIEFTSPGMLSRDVTIERMKEGYSKPRNRGIANVFAYLKIIEGWGGGIPKVLDECRKYGLREPEFIECDSDFRINVFRKPFEIDQHGVIDPKTIGNIKTSDNTESTNSTENDIESADSTENDIESANSTENRIISLIKGNPSITIIEMASQSGLSIGTVRYALDALRKRGMIKREGAQKRGNWIVL